MKVVRWLGSVVPRPNAVVGAAPTGGGRGKPWGPVRYRPVAVTPFTGEGVLGAVGVCRALALPTASGQPLA